MTRFAWLQARTQTLVAAGLLGALAVALAVTGVQLSHQYSSLVAPCPAGSDCGLAISEFLSHDVFLQDALTFFMRVAPALFGIFWGAPLLARELESGTYRLAWTQTVSRSRWLLTKVGVGLLATAAVAGALTLAVTWWFRAVDSVSDNRYGVFDARGLVPVGYAVFAFALGAMAGAVVRRTLPAMAISLGALVAVRLAVQQWVRPHLLPPLRAILPLGSSDQFGFEIRGGSTPMIVAKAAAPPNSWRISSQLVTRSGHVATSSDRAEFVRQHCAAVARLGGGPSPGHRGVEKAPDVSAFDACREQAGRAYHFVLTYQPAGRYWALQWLETGVYLVLALAAVAGCYWWITRRSG